MLHTALPLILALAAPNMKFDANESAVFALELEYVDKQATDQEFPQNRADEFIPVDTSIDAGAEDFSWYHFDRLGNAKLISSYADDLPRVHEFGSKNTTGIRSIGDSYGYSIQDLRAAAYMKRPLDPALALLAREAIERKADEIAALGSTTDNLPGFLKATGVPVMSSGFNGDWANATGQEILADLRLIYFTAKKSEPRDPRARHDDLRVGLVRRAPQALLGLAGRHGRGRVPPVLPHGQVDRHLDLLRQRRRPERR